MKKVLTLVTALVVVTAMSFVAFGEDASAVSSANIGKAKAKTIALKNAKTSKGKVRNLKAEFDDEDGVYEIEFIKKKNGAEYEYDIAASNGKILKKCVEYRYNAKRSGKKIGTRKENV